MFGGNINPAKKHEAPPPDEHGGDQPMDEAQGGDGFHHHEMHENESGIHSVHTSPDGNEEHADHGTYEEAKAHQDDMMGHGGDDEGKDWDEDSGQNDGREDGPDFSKRYSS